MDGKEAAQQHGAPALSDGGRGIDENHRHATDNDESAIDDDGTFREKSADTRIFIRPPYEFRAVDRLITNFHLPRSTLVMLVAAFAGYDLTMRAYREAIAERYRLYSYGDAMLITG